MMTTIYRNYDVAKLGDTFVGQSRDDESLMISRSHARLMAAIDQMWAGLDRGVVPAWFSGSSAIDLDAISLDEVTPEATPSETDPPATKQWRVPYWMFGLAAFGVSAPIAFAMDFLQIDARIDVMLALGVCAAALAWGRSYALIVAVIAAIIVNFFAVDPLLTFSWPKWSEFLNIAVDLGAAFAIPLFARGEGPFRHSRE
ncbi:DUF4118 domain-containing protein [Bradyrhizobium pachyrhizi]|uniref:DUF4118 domain-containing protein n=1 Tax=Bradyrhizobium pachyrhizi TaxID=280333 RepID=UPI0024B0D379|nr:DUF4118 domain-containing protein [Bradyrhizobium pachyrhizi]WFU52354.1 DUF4118 domain-containing protein [Bradyrhizobium pachyrhizi]